MFKKNIATVVSGLLLCGTPLAVFLLIVAVVVFSVELQAFFIALGHVGYEVVDIKPSVANLYAATAVAMVSLVFWICAAPNHGAPDSKKRMVPRAMFCDGLFTKAPATLRSAISECVASDVARRTTARTLDLGKKRFNTLFLEDAKNGVSGKNIACLHKFGFGSNHASLLVSSD